MEAKEALTQLYNLTRALQAGAEVHDNARTLAQIVLRALEPGETITDKNTQNDNGELQRQAVDQLER